MRVIPLQRNPELYSCKAYLIIGDWNRLDDVNTLVDVGSDGYIIDEIDSIATGCGKTAVEQVVLTHSHFDHVSGLQAIREKYGPKVFAFSKFDGVDAAVAEGDRLRMGDRDFFVMHAPGHSNDSICLYCPQEKVLFSGDTTLRILTPGGSYEPGYLRLLELLAGMEIDVVYSGHDAPVTSDAKRMLGETLERVKDTVGRSAVCA